MKLLVQLNADWRILVGKKQHLVWRLERRIGDKWEYATDCQKRNTLLHWIREKCGTVDPSAVAVVRKLPHYIPDPIWELTLKRNRDDAVKPKKKRRR